MKKEEVIKKAVGAHQLKYGKKPQSVAWAPGRIEVLGNHTDYNEGTVLSAAINMGHCFCISKATHNGINALAVDVKKSVSFTANNTEKVKGASWANYIKGVFFFLSEYLGKPIEGIDCTFFGSIPMGAGLSSSAALEVAAAYAVLDILSENIDKNEIAKLCQKAEHKFAGTNCGLLDQFSSIFGQEHGLIHSDFRSFDVSGVKLPEDIEFLVLNPKVKHSLANSPYNERRERCEQAVAQLDELLPHKVDALRDVSWEEFEANREKIDEFPAKRAAHIIGEITKVESGVKILNQGDVAIFGEMLYLSHESSRDMFENSCSEIDVVVDAAKKAGALGARISGGGFGGAAIAMVYADDAESIGEKIKTICKESDIDPDVIEIVPSAGAMIIDKF